MKVKDYIKHYNAFIESGDDKELAVLTIKSNMIDEMFALFKSRKCSTPSAYYAAHKEIRDKWKKFLIDVYGTMYDDFDEILSRRAPVLTRVISDYISSISQRRTVR